MQLRLENILYKRFLETYVKPRHPRRREAVDSTLFRISQFFGWREALQQGVQFLNFREPQRSKRVSDLLAEITMAWATDWYGPELMIWQESQRAIGELMLTENGGKPSVRGFGWFSKNRSTIEPYLRPVKDAIEKGLGPNSKRLSDIRKFLDELVKELDPEGIRFLYKSKEADAS